LAFFIGSLLVFGESFGERVPFRAERETLLTETTMASGLFQVLLIEVIDRHKPGRQPWRSGKTLTIC